MALFSVFRKKITLDSSDIIFLLQSEQYHQALAEITLPEIKCFNIFSLIILSRVRPLHKTF